MDMNDWGLIFMYCNVSEWTNTSFDPDLYLNELHNYPLKNFDRIVVRGENYKKELTNDKLILNGNDAYDYVGFRYVRTYLIEQYGTPLILGKPLNE
jgi:formylglycine-generating enzyme required for sulfatase activity